MVDGPGTDPADPSPGPSRPLLRPDPSDIAHVFAVFAEPARLQLLELLCAGDRRLSECVDAVGLDASLVSAHLRDLAECGLVSAPRRGRHGRYRICEPRVRALLALARSLTEDNAHALRSCLYTPDTNQ